MQPLQDFLTKHTLGAEYLKHAQCYFDPVIDFFVTQSLKSDKPFLLGVNGAQGSGKTTFSDYVVAYTRAKGLYSVSLSLDDFYLSKAERKALALNVHPLFSTRGVPGTHNYQLMKSVLVELSSGSLPLLPAFDKGSDDCVPQDRWQRPQQVPDLVIIEGWCWGATPQAEEQLAVPVNSLERIEDAEQIWRRYANQQITDELLPLYEFMDAWCMLKSPSFSTVKSWRCEQEHKLKRKLALNGGDDSGVMSDAEIERFILHYQRITECILDSLPRRADLVWNLDADRQITSVSGCQTGLVESLEAVGGA